MNKMDFLFVKFTNETHNKNSTKLSNLEKWNQITKCLHLKIKIKTDAKILGMDNVWFGN